MTCLQEGMRKCMVKLVNYEKVQEIPQDISVPVRAEHLPLIEIRLKPEGKYPWKRQYTLKPETVRGNQPLHTKFFKHGLIQPRTLCNTPIFWSQSLTMGSTGLCKTVMTDCEAFIPTHPPVPNLYTLLTYVPGNAHCFSVLNLKDALLCIPLHLDLHSFLAFEWKDPDILKATQCTWTVLLQSFMSPHLFGNMLARTEPEKWGSLRKC